MIRIRCSALWLLLAAGAIAAAGEIPQGNEPPPPSNQPAEGVAPTAPGVVPAQTTTPEDVRARIEAGQKEQARLIKIIDECLVPVKPVDPSAEQQAAVAKAVAGFASADPKLREQASAEALKLGPAAIAGLRAAAKSKDAEVAKRAAEALETIESHPDLLAKLEQVARLDLVDALIACQDKAGAELRQAEADAAKDKDESGQAAQRVKELKARLATLAKFRAQFPMRAN